MDERPANQRSAAPAVVAGMVVAVAAAGLAWLRFHDAPHAEVPPAAEPVVTRPQEGFDAGPTLNPDDGDAVVKQLASRWSADPRFQAWLTGPTVRALTAAAQLVSDGESPATALPFLHVTGAYEVREDHGHTFVSAKSWARYDELTQTFTSVDAAAVGDAWSSLRPYFEGAFREVGKPGQRFDDALAQALRRLLAVQFPTGDVELIPHGLMWRYADPSLEQLGAPEKQLLRLGPDNGRRVQAKLREFAVHAHLPL